MTGGRTNLRGLRLAGWATIATLGAIALFLFADRTTMPIVLWDESRNIVNALEMRAHGWSLVTTYGGLPDLWNTKPPLLIWAMVASADLFGASEWTLRLPSMLAALATCAIVMRHVLRAAGSPGTAVLAAALLAVSPAMFGEHSARTADYDALLVAFTTGYCSLAYLTLGRRRPRSTTLLVAGGAVAGAVLTKSVAGLVPGLGLAVFALASGRWRRVVGDPRYLIAAGAAVVPVAAFFIAREVAGPGYFAAAWHNDGLGRFVAAVVGVERPWSFYLSDLAAGYFAVPLLLVAIPLAWRTMSLRERMAAGHATAIVLAVLAVTSAAASKLHHYILPALPFMAVAAAITARAVWREAWRGLQRPGAPRVAAVAMLLLLGFSGYGAIQRAIMLRYVTPQVGEGARSGGYGALFAALPPGAIAVVDAGFVIEGRPGYAPVLDAYRLLARERGLVVRRAGVAVGPGTVASCDAGTVVGLMQAGRVVARAPGCVAVWIGG